MLTFLSPSDSNSNEESIQASLSPDMLIKGEVCGYCDGLFLCFSNRYTSGRGYFVYDPLTKETTHTPLFPGATISKDLYAVGFNSITQYSIRNFSVVLVPSFVNTIHEFKVYVFSRKISKWSMIVVSVDHCFAFAPQWMHSLAHLEYLLFMGQTKILVLDHSLVQSYSYTIGYPDGVDGMNMVNCGFQGRSGGFLRIGYIDLNNELKVWELVWKNDDINDEESNPQQFWFLMYKINICVHLPAHFCNNYFKHVAGFHPYDEDIVYFHSYIDGVFIANLKTNKFEHVIGYDKFDISPFQLELPIPNSSYFIFGHHESIVFYRKDAESQKIEDIRCCPYLEGRI